MSFCLSASLSGPSGSVIQVGILSVAILSSVINSVASGPCWQGFNIMRSSAIRDDAKGFNDAVDDAEDSIGAMALSSSNRLVDWETEGGAIEGGTDCIVSTIRPAGCVTPTVEYSSDKSSA